MIDIDIDSLFFFGGGSGIFTVTVQWNTSYDFSGEEESFETKSIPFDFLGEEAEVVITKSLGQLLRHVAEWRSTYDVRLCQLNNIPTEKLVVGRGGGGIGMLLIKSPKSTVLAATQEGIHCTVAWYFVFPQTNTFQILFPFSLHPWKTYNCFALLI